MTATTTALSLDKDYNVKEGAVGNTDAFVWVTLLSEDVIMSCVKIL